MAEYLRHLGRCFFFFFVLTVLPPPALHAVAVVSDDFPFRFPFGFPVDAFAGAGFKIGHAHRPRAVPVFAALTANGQCFDGFGVLEEVAQGARGTGAFDADDTACIRDADKDVFVRLEDGEKAFGLLGYQFSGC